MQKLTDATILYSPSDLTKWMECAHATVLDIRAFEEDLKRSENSASTLLLQRKGFEHEAAFLQSLKDQGKTVTEIPKDGFSLQQRADLTLEALKSGVDVVFQGVFFEGVWRGDADFLVRVETASSFGAFSYEVYDTKLARTARPKHVMQLCLYSDILGRLQGVMPEHIHVALGNHDLTTVRLDDYIHYFRVAKVRFETFVRTTNVAASKPEPCHYCSLCTWRELCENAWEETDHLSRVANIQRGHIQKLEAVGISTLTALAQSQPDHGIEGLNADVFDRLRSQAALQLNQIKTGKPEVIAIAAAKGKGFERLPKPNEGDLFFDMEGDPLFEGGLEYLFGVWYWNGTDYSFNTFWAHDHVEERAAFADFMTFVEAHMKVHPDAFIYHYNHYETTALKRLSLRYAVSEQYVDHLLRHSKFVDLYKVVREAIRISQPSYSIKYLEIFYMEKRDGEVATAGDSIVVYNEWRETRDQTLLDNIAEYNCVDCVSTLKLRDWLLTLKPDVSDWFRADTEAAFLEAGDQTPLKDWEIEYAQYQAKLKAISTQADDEAARLTDILEFHNREAKPQFWELFARKDKFTDELIEDQACLGGLVQIGDPIPDKKSFVYTYSVPTQETKLKVGSQVTDAATGNNLGAIIALENGTVSIRIGPKAAALVPSEINIGPGRPIDADEIRAAIYRKADAILAGSKLYGATSDILNKTAPRFKGREPGTPILGPGNTVAETLAALIDLDNSYLFIQGPPGAGKTYTSAHTIVGLMQAGFRVGVAANSHKAIHNLLTQIEQAAKTQGYNFKGYKKSSTSNPESVFDTDMITSIDKPDKVPLDGQLYAGTSFFFPMERFDQLLDYLFVDEAGQVSTANVVAMGMATRNIVLVGDQMQLAQPSEGVHPNEAALSVLEFLLGGQATVAPDRGIFLAHTRRLHPDICKFISESFYEGRLEPHQDNAARHLHLSADTGITPSEGIIYHPAEHRGCSSRSEVEGAIIANYIQKLVGQPFEKIGGPVEPLTLEDILVVTPYNVQVNYLTQVLPEGTRVGTVDKFQGQEAAVVLISMATSGAADLPRNIEFLFSKNRLNVAISRAQCLAVVVCSPHLMDVPCHTLAQMTLVNTFCRLPDYAPAFNQAGAATAA